MAALARLVLSLFAALALTGHPTAAGNRHAAYRDAGRLLARVVLPPGARPLRSAPGGAGGLLDGPFQTPSGKLVDRHRLWRVPEPLDSVVAFVRAHRPRRLRKEGSGSGSSGGPGIPANETLFFAFPAQHARTSLRWLNVTMVALPDGSTGVRADAQEIWIVPRPTTEVVPLGVREVDVRTPRRSWRVTKPRKVARIVRWFDGLPTVQPGVFHCPAFVSRPTVTLEFRGAKGSILAHARSPAVTGPCSPTVFSIRGRQQTPLVGGRFLRRVKRLLR